jgi:peptide subunit release factor 1 (eRF1)
MCPKCHFLYASYEICPGCKIHTQPQVDVIDEAIEMAMNKNCEVKHINPPTQLQEYGNIGAFLRFKP